jgi:hypothetical protein
MAYKYLNRSAVLEHLQEGQTVNIDEYIEKMQFFKKYVNCHGIYITDSRYIEYSEIGLHYYKYDTLIKFFENFKDSIIFSAVMVFPSLFCCSIRESLL